MIPSCEYTHSCLCTSLHAVSKININITLCLNNHIVFPNSSVTAAPQLCFHFLNRWLYVCIRVCIGYKLDSEGQGKTERKNNSKWEERYRIKKQKDEKERNFSVGGQVTNSNSAIQRPHVRRDESQKCQINVS